MVEQWLKWDSDCSMAVCVLYAVTLLDTTLKESLEWVTYTRQHDDPQKRGVSLFIVIWYRNLETWTIVTVLISHVDGKLLRNAYRIKTRNKNTPIYRTKTYVGPVPTCYSSVLLILNIDRLR